MARYMYSIRINIDKLGVTYIIDDLLNAKLYKLEGNIGCLQSGRVYKIEDMHLYESDDKSYCIKRHIQGRRYLQPTTRIIDGACIENNIELNLKYKEVSNVLLKGRVLLNNVAVSNSLVEILEIDNDDKKTSLGTILTDKDGMYYINLPLNKGYCYKIIATYVYN